MTDENNNQVQDGTLYSVLYQVLLAFVIIGAFIIGYELLRQSKIGKYIYAPRLLLLPDQTPDVANGWFSWFQKNKKIDEEYILRNNGLDAVMVLKLYRMGYQMFMYIGLFVVIFTLPVNILFRDRTRSLSDECNGSMVSECQNITEEVDTSSQKSMLYNIFDKRNDIPNINDLNLTIEKDREEFFNEEIKILNAIKDSLKNDDNNNENEDINEEEATNREVNFDENGSSNNSSYIDKDINNNNNQTTLVDDLNKQKEKLKEHLSFDIKKYIFFDKMNEGKEMYSLFHIVAVYFVVSIICYKLFKIYQDYLVSMEKYVKDGGIVQERNLFGEILQHSTIMVRNIPPELQDDQRLMNWFTKLGIGKIEGVVIARSRNKIRNLILERTEILNNLENDYVHWLVNIKERNSGEGMLGKLFKNVIPDETDDIGEKVFEDNDLYRPKRVIFKYKIIPVRYVDSIHYNEQKLVDLTHRIKELRLEAAESKKWSQTAFITFSNHQSAKIAAQLILYSSQNPNVMAVTTAPHPNDLIYKNLNIRTENKTYRSLGIYVAMYFTCFILAILVIATKYDTLRIFLCESVYFKGFGFNKIYEAIDRSPKLSGLFQSFFQVILLNVYTSCVPYILRFLSNFQGFETKSSYANSILKKYYVYLVITIIFSLSISTLAGSIYDPKNYKIKSEKFVDNFFINIVKRIMNLNPTQFVQSLTEELTKNSITYFNYGILRLQSFGFEIFRIGAVCSFFLKKLLKKNSPRAQHMAKQMASPPNYSVMLAVPLLCFTIFITFSIVNPFISFVGVVFFFIGYHVMKNQFIYVYIKDYESQGHYFVTAFNRIIFSLFLFEIFMFGYFLAVFSKTEGYKKYIPYLIVPSFFITYYFYNYCRKCFKPRIDNVPVDLLISKERNRKYSNHFQRRTIFGRRESFASDYYSEDSFISCATHITSLDSKPTKEILKISKSQAPDLPPYYEAKSYNNPALTKILYAPWIPDEAQNVFTESTLNNIAAICKDCYKCDKESRFD